MIELGAEGRMIEMQLGRWRWASSPTGSP
ncbi:MAG: hypothetical protein U0R24_15665 [Solirubrobacterales bacterium]